MKIFKNILDRIRYLRIAPLFNHRARRRLAARRRKAGQIMATSYAGWFYRARRLHNAKMAVIHGG